MNELINQKEGSAKKARVVFVSLFIVFTFLGSKLFGYNNEFLLNPLILSLLYSFVSALGFLWVLLFKVNFRIIAFIIPHLSLIIFSQMLFVQMFFERSFGRIYETLLMIVMLLLIFSITYATFLTSNIFAVASFKRIPLEAVAKTSIYFISVLSVFFVTYGFLSLELDLIYVGFALVLIFFLFTIFLLMYFYVEVSTILSNSFMVFWNVLLVFIGAVLFSSRIEFVALLVAMVFYYCAGLFVEKRYETAYTKLFEYFFVVLMIILLTFYFSI